MLFLYLHPVADERIDIFDEQNVSCVGSALKSKAHRTGLWHRAVHIWVYTPQGMLLLQLRSKNKLLYPGVWDVSAAGHVSAGESVISSALRELEEELGIVAQANELLFWKIFTSSNTQNGLFDNEFRYVYFLCREIVPQEITLQQEEVEEYRFISLQDLRDDLIKHSAHYALHGEMWFVVLDELSARMNNHSL